ncbi:Crp/Fnr family transcriptional regulator [Rhodohalobacter mucosus]|uniref:Cyclic nucleotide-binding domain-containing protein n=1 Tax=Rhodohalobacter mucosus TaxID=2079485 RepID=A0A316TUS2_9BACT|nr:cyclic nucleotide-binding domain-containing protein [Rhodohalobacter mucosus]PWN07608.1 cyclic nucleotide-binding domain-containing protein [Rhodohalobacter mucosus]
MNDGNPLNMMPAYKRNLLKDPPHLLKNFHYEDVLGFLELGREEKFQKGETVVNENDRVSSAYLIAEGKVGVWRDGIQLAVLEEGSFIGETFLFSKQNRMAKVISENQSVLLSFERYDVLSFFRKKPEKLFNIFTKNIIEIQQKKINNMNSQLLNLKRRLLSGDNW